MRVCEVTYDKTPLEKDGITVMVKDFPPTQVSTVYVTGCSLITQHWFGGYFIHIIYRNTGGFGTLVCSTALLKLTTSQKWRDL